MKSSSCFSNVKQLALFLLLSEGQHSNRDRCICACSVTHQLQISHIKDKEEKRINKRPAWVKEQMQISKFGTDVTVAFQTQDPYFIPPPRRVPRMNIRWNSAYRVMLFIIQADCSNKRFRHKHGGIFSSGVNPVGWQLTAIC